MSHTKVMETILVHFKTNGWIKVNFKVNSKIKERVKIKTKANHLIKAKCSYGFDSAQNCRRMLDWDEMSEIWFKDKCGEWKGECHLLIWFVLIPLMPVLCALCFVLRFNVMIWFMMCARACIPCVGDSVKSRDTHRSFETTNCLGQRRTRKTTNFAQKCGHRENWEKVNRLEEIFFQTNYWWHVCIDRATFLFTLQPTFILHIIIYQFSLFENDFRYTNIGIFDSGSSFIHMLLPLFA